LHGTTLGYCIRWAYGVLPYQIAGPPWMDPPTDVLFDIDAKAGSPIPEPQLKLMLQASAHGPRPRPAAGRPLLH